MNRAVMVPKGPALWREFLSYYRPHRRLLLAVFGCAALSGVLELGFPIKTTLCSLLPRFYDVDAGRITVDGLDIQDIARPSLRRQIGIVERDVFLFADSIRDNVAHGKLGASQHEVVDPARR